MSSDWEVSTPGKYPRSLGHNYRSLVSLHLLEWQVYESSGSRFPADHQCTESARHTGGTRSLLILQAGNRCYEVGCKYEPLGAPGWLSRLSVRLWLRSWFQPHIGLYADSSEFGACFGFCVTLSLCSSPFRSLSLSLCQK